MITTILAFLVTIGVLIVVHEYGHYRVAVACDVKVLRFSVGFGRVLWQWRRGETEFAVSALPLGGYVRMLDEREGPVAPAEVHRAFNRKSLLQRSLVVAAGPAANLLLAVLLYAGANWIGIDEARAVMGSPVAGSLADRAGLRAGDEVLAASSDAAEWTDVRSMTDLRWQITQALVGHKPLTLRVAPAQSRGQHNVTLDLGSPSAPEVDNAMMRNIGIGAPYSDPVLGEVREGGAAARAGLMLGDRVLAVDDVAVVDATQLRGLIRNAVDKDAQQARTQRWKVDRHGKTLEVAVTPAAVADGERRVGRIEAFVGAPVEMVKVRYGFVDGLTNGFTRTWEVSALTFKMLGRMLIGEASLKNLSGPITIADYAGQSVQLGVAYYLGFLALVSVSLGVLNLLPLPMLDGGHLMYYLFEGVTGRPVSELWLKWLQRGGAVVMLLLMTLALSNDVARLLGLQ